ncbi:rIIB protein [Raoultella phage Ro1]|uniref:RIIB protein n=1 Tax=Raoultella phage Ro1 TaxID=2053702 RepID=A0A2H4YH24_9CAUD|nr:RIIB lysis inhibitor [Raoultella phage Ro1]AUE23471.1 rIIB protein [Raoultella phage Ro1]
MSNLFKSRADARVCAASRGMKVVDRGVSPAVLAEGRWMVVPKDSIGASPEKTISFDMETYPAPTASMFFGSRGEARAFSKTVQNAKIIDHAQGPRGVNYGVVKDLGKRGKRWEVVFVVSDVEVSVIVPQLPEPTSVPINISVVDDTKADPIVIMTPGNVSITLPDGTIHTLGSNSEIFNDVGMLLLNNKIDEAVALIEAGIAAKAEVAIDLGPDMKLLDGVLYWHGIKQESGIARRIVSDIETGKFDNRYVEFMRKLMLNPSYKSVEMLYDFLEHNKFTILENGNILAYKGLKRTEHGPRDWYTGLVPNWANTTVTMPRNMVEDDPTKACSQGLHIAAAEYARSYGNVVEVSVDPADIVSVPYNYNNKKCRCCRYEVLTGKEKPEGAPDVIVVGVQGAILDEIYLDKED